MLKFIERLRSRLLSSTATGLIAVLALGGTVAAITSPDFIYSTTKTGYFTIHPMALAPDVDTAQYSNFYPTATLAAVTGSCFSTGVNLPHGSRITQLAVWYNSPAGSDPVFYLMSHNLTNANTSFLVSNEEIPDDTNTRKLAVLPILGGTVPVSNTGFSYGFGVCPGTGGAFRGARIAYTYTSSGD